jgi:glycosyltransferase involved in cell wall biosynthesis
MKIAVYAIALNEEDNIHTWYESTKNADYHLIVDTGSTDKTIEIAKSLGINVFSISVNPWSEHVAKTTALSLLPNDIDYCLLLDLDEYIEEEDWTETLKNHSEQIILHSRINHSGFYDEQIPSEERRIHKRFNTIFIGTRPIPTASSESFNTQSKKIKITIIHKPGNNERFEDREKRYVELFKDNYLRLKKEKSYIDFNILQNLVHYALAVFELGDFDLFIKLLEEYEEKFYKLQKKHIGNYNYESIFSVPEDNYTTLLYAKSLIMDECSKEIFLKALIDLKFNHKKLLAARCAIFALLTNDKELLNTAYEYSKNYEDVVYFYGTNQVFEIIKDFNIKSLNDEQMHTLIEFYGNLKIGKNYKELTRKIFKKYLGDLNV